MTREAELTWRAQPRQAVFLGRGEDEVLYGGAAGGGKTDALLIHLISRCARYAGHKGLFLRRTYADLSKGGSALDRSRELLTGSAHYTPETHRWTFPNESFFEFGYLQYESDKYNYQSSQYDSVNWDEVTQFTLSQYLYLLSRNRATIEGCPPECRAGTNPGGVGHGWVKERFVDPSLPESRFTLPRVEGDDGPRHGCFIPAKLADNQVLMDRDPGYRGRLAALPEEERRALMDGDWDVFIGQYFREWRREKHVVDPFSIPTTWRKWGGLDWGFAKPLAFVVFTQDPDSNRIYLIRELYAAELHDAEAIERIWATMAGDRLDAIYADPSMWQRRSADDTMFTSTGETYVIKGGLPLLPANHDRLNGWRRVRDLLAVQRDELPGFQVFANCTNFIRTFPSLVYDQSRPEDCDSDGEDHAADAVRYGLLARAINRHEEAEVEREQAAWERRVQSPESRVPSLRR